MAIPNSCVLLGPNGSLKFWCFNGNRDNFDAKFFTSLSPISVSGIRELLVGTSAEHYYADCRGPWEQTARVRGAFGVLTKVENLPIVSRRMEPFLRHLVRQRTALSSFPDYGS